MAKTQDHVFTDRGGVIENRHLVHAAIVDAQGKLLYSVGDPSRITLVRSAAKPAQALAVLETGAPKQFGFDDADLALMCASHNGEARHISRAFAMLAKVDAREQDLRCGGHAALSASVNRAWIKSDYTPTEICNNCSGKHVGMLGGSKAIGAAIADYHLPTHPIQLRVKRVVEDLCGLEADSCQWGIDGCNLPAPAFPLHYLGKMYAALSAAADSMAVDCSASARERGLSRIYHAMTQYPELVGGEGRFCTALMQAFGGSLVGKVGADGCYGIGIRASEATDRVGAAGAIGIAVKIEDGNLEILYAAVMEILEQLQIGTRDARGRLADFHRPVITNSAGVVTGHTSHEVIVRPAMAL
ncbi:asparaginase [Aspergillus candidus]|uniref:L-asparaginase II n=1 Tax=Aspergillus candidus TaxID=41067 RepID=A0A2I2F890_ASPCN|nr:L-asparaginase II [Aspergillus candidus]PLB36839.1 L-asparaginase II [Aspergillus candidus]